MNPFITAPTNQLSKDSVKVWLISDGVINLVGFLILGGLFIADHIFTWAPWAFWLLVAVTVVSFFGAVWGCWKPFLLYKHWRYGISEEFLQLKSGALHEEHQLIPMTKIQSVSTHQGPLLKKYHLYSIKVHTMGSIHTIPALPEATALALRDQIARYAKVEEV
ncbi:hypothetical protein EQV77_06270 [Halobacillus fulvus]|nr:hypothetical protein EQV77_06270 [Halobacillus fulvus]